MGKRGMKHKLVYAIVAVAFVGGLFSAAYAGPILNTITLAGNVQVNGDLNVDGTITGDVSGVTLAGDTQIIQNVGTEPILELTTTPTSTAPPFLVTDSSANELFKINQDGSIQIGSNTIVIEPDGTISGPVHLAPGSTLDGLDIDLILTGLDEDIIELRLNTGAVIDALEQNFGFAISLLEDRVIVLENQQSSFPTVYRVSDTVSVPGNSMPIVVIVTTECDVGDLPIEGTVIRQSGGDILTQFPTGHVYQNTVHIGYFFNLLNTVPQSATVTSICLDTAAPFRTP